MTRTRATGLSYPHGTYLSYQHRPCRCEDCTRAWKVYQQQLLSRHRRGEVWADRDRYMRLLAPFRNAKVTPTALSRATGVRPATVRKLMFGTGRVRAEVAARVDDLTWADLDGQALVDAEIFRRLMGVLLERGLTRHAIAAELGWGGWPGESYPDGERVQLRLVRRLEWLSGHHSHAPTNDACEDCGRESLAGGRWCYPCFLEHRSAA